MSDIQWLSIASLFNTFVVLLLTQRIYKLEKQIKKRKNET
jgi:hypothetical protein